MECHQVFFVAQFGKKTTSLQLSEILQRFPQLLGWLGSTWWCSHLHDHQSSGQVGTLTSWTRTGPFFLVQKSEHFFILASWNWIGVNLLLIKPVVGMRLDFYPVAPNSKQSLFSWPWLSLIWYSYHEDSGNVICFHRRSDTCWEIRNSFGIRF